MTWEGLEESAVAESKHCLEMCIEELGETTKDLKIGNYSNRTPSEHYRHYILGRDIVM
jgi:hypothetical protein